MTIIEQLRAEINERKEKIKSIQDACSHPLAARETENHWTNHRCLLCGKRWVTDQGWDRDGGLGMPEDRQ